MDTKVSEQRELVISLLVKENQILKKINEANDNIIKTQGDMLKMQEEIIEMIKKSVAKTTK